jgi:hypothetical protein
MEEHGRGKGSHAGESYTSKLNSPFARRIEAVVAECEGLRQTARCERDARRKPWTVELVRSVLRASMPGSLRLL